MKNKVIVETDRLFLRQMNEDDFDALYLVLTDTEIMQHYPYIFDEKKVSEWNNACVGSIQGGKPRWFLISRKNTKSFTCRRISPLS